MSSQNKCAFRYLSVFGNYALKLDCFADDTGLEVKSLGGQPGVHTARYAFPDRNDAEANSICSVLKQFINTPDETLIRMGKQSKDLANKLFDFHTNMDKWEALIFKLAK